MRSKREHGVLRGQKSGNLSCWEALNVSEDGFHTRSRTAATKSDQLNIVNKQLKRGDSKMVRKSVQVIQIFTSNDLLTVRR